MLLRLASSLATVVRQSGRLAVRLAGSETKIRVLAFLIKILYPATY